MPEHVPELGACLEWTGTTLDHRGGYGSFYDDGGKLRRAHRVAWEISTGETLSEEEHILHRCDNPPCIRYRHLFKGDQVVNMDDMTEKGRRRGGAEHGEQRYNAKLTDEIVRTARIRFGHGETVDALAREAGVTRSCMSSAIRRKSWAHVT